MARNENVPEIPTFGASGMNTNFEDDASTGERSLESSESIDTVVTNETGESAGTNDSSVFSRRSKKENDPLSIQQQKHINSLDQNVTLSSSGHLIIPHDFFEEFFNGGSNYHMHFCKHTISYYGFFYHVLMKNGCITPEQIAHWNDRKNLQQEHYTKWQLFAKQFFFTEYDFMAKLEFEVEVRKRALYLGLQRDNDNQNEKNVMSILDILRQGDYHDYFKHDNMIQLCFKLLIF